MKNMKKLVALLLAVVMVIGMTACGAKEEPAPTPEPDNTIDTTGMGPIMKDIAENGVIKAAVIGNDPTFCFHTIVEGKDVLAGFEIAGIDEMAKRLGEYLGREVTVDYYEADFTGCMSALEAGKVHFVPRLSPTDERKLTWQFTDVYHKSNECYVAKADADTSKFVGTLQGVKVAGVMGTIDITMTQHLYPDAEIQELSSTADCLIAVKSGKADLACMNAVAASMAVVANEDLMKVDALEWVPTDDFDKGCGLCFAQGNDDFAEWASGFFADIAKEGLWAQMQVDAAEMLDAEALKDYVITMQ